MGLALNSTAAYALLYALSRLRKPDPIIVDIIAALEHGIIDLVAREDENKANNH
jgi:hypothetical protein